MLKKLFWLLGVILNAGQCFSQFLPSEPHRTLSFTVTEGSYMSVDVSSDGKTLLFDLLGDIYSVPSEGGKAKQLTRGISLHLRPTWSLDKKRFAYLSDTLGSFRYCVRDIFSGSTSVGNSATTYSKAFWGFETKNKNGVTIFPLSISSDMKFGYFEDDKKFFEVNYLTKTTTQVDPALMPEIKKERCSPDSKWVVFFRDTIDKRSLIIKNRKNKKERILVPSIPSVSDIYKVYVPESDFSFSPDSKYVFIAYGGKIHKINTLTGKDSIVPFQADVKIDLGNFVYNKYKLSYQPFNIHYARSANISPDKKTIVCSALGKIYIIDVASGASIKLLNRDENQFQPSISPDGNWISYVSWKDSIGGSLWKVPITGGSPQKLTQIPGQYQHPIWSPDGKSIAVIHARPTWGDRDSPGNGNLENVSANGEKIEKIEENIPLLNQLSFSFDGKKIIYRPNNSSPGSEDLLLVSKDLVTGEVDSLLKGNMEPKNLQYCISPDGRFLIYSAFENIHVMPLYSKKVGIPLTLNREDSKIIAEGIDPIWSADAKELSWTYANKFFSLSADSLEILTKRVGPFVPELKQFPIEIKAEAGFGKGMTAFLNARIITINKNQVIENGVIIIEDGRILSVGEKSQIKIPEQATRFDLSGKTIIPGLIDLHLHMRLAPDIFPQQSWMFLANLAYGVTTARDPSSSYDSFGLSELLRTHQMVGPRLFSVGRPIRDDYSIENLEDAKAIVNKRKALGALVVKQYMLKTRQQKQWLLKACEENQLNMTNEGAFNPLDQIAMIKDGSTGIEHNPLWVEIYDDILSLYAFSGVFLTPTLQVSNGTDQAKEYMKSKFWRFPDEKIKRFIPAKTYFEGKTDNGAESLETILRSSPADTTKSSFLIPATWDTKIMRKGGSIGLGSHGNNQGIGAHNEIWTLQMGGFSNMEALEAATLTGAKALGLQSDLGSLEVGKIADLIILNKNPLEDIHHTKEIKWVMKDGVLYNADTLDEVWPRKRKTPDLSHLKENIAIEN